MCIVRDSSSTNSYLAYSSVVGGISRHTEGSSPVAIEVEIEWYLGPFIYK